MKYILYSILLTTLISCSYVETAKNLFFANQLTPTVNSSLELLSAHFNCLQANNFNITKDFRSVIFTVKGKKDSFKLVTTNSPHLSCNKNSYYSDVKMPFNNKLLKWVNKERTDFNHDTSHGKRYNFGQMYSNITYDFMISQTSPTQIKIEIKRTSINIESNHFYEHHTFFAYIDKNKKIKFQDDYLDKNSKFSW